MSRDDKADPVCLGYLALLHSSRSIRRFRDVNKAKMLAAQVYPALLSQCVRSNDKKQYLYLNKHKLFILGSLYSLGLGCDKDNREAFKCFQLSSLDDFPPSISGLANCYALGIGVSKDPEAGFRLFRRAADLGDPVARYNLGVCYKEGIGVPRNYWQALVCYYLAARQGYVHPSHSFFDTFCLMLCFTTGVLLLVICLILIIVLLS
jgi:TPR repeat protein